MHLSTVGQGDELIALIEDLERGEFEMPNSADIIPLSKQDVLSIPDTRCIFCENPDELDDESFGEAYTEALDMYDWLNKYAPRAFVLVETDATDDRNHFHRLYLVPANVWDGVKAELLPDVAD